MTPALVREVLRELDLEGFDLVVLDASPELSAVNTTALTACDDVFVVVVPTAGGVQDAYRSTEALRRLGLRHQLRYVINRSRSDTDLSEPLADLGGQLVGDIPEDDALVAAENAHRVVGLDDSGLGRGRAPPAGAQVRERVACDVAGVSGRPRVPLRQQSVPVSFHFRPVDDRVELPGFMVAVLATSDLDINGLDPARKSSAAAAFARMCHVLERPMQLLIRVRPLAEPEPPRRGRPHPELDAAMHSHWTERIRDSPRHKRTVYVVLTETTAARTQRGLHARTRWARGNRRRERSGSKMSSCGRR